MNKFKSNTLGVCLVLCSANSIAMLKPLQNISLPSYKTMGFAAGGMGAIGLSCLLYKKKHLRNKIVRIVKRNPKKIILYASIISALGLAYYCGLFALAKSSLHKFLYGSENPVVANNPSDLANLPQSGLDRTDSGVSPEGANNALDGLE